MPEEEEPSRRTFLKVSAVAGASVAAVAAGASMIPKISALTPGSIKPAEEKSSERKAAISSASSMTGEPLILVIQGQDVDVYSGENKFPIKDSALARELTSRVAAKVGV
jgi:hypothetical protein